MTHNSKCALEKNLIGSFRKFSMPQWVAKKLKNSNNCHFSPIFGDKLVNWNMKFQTQHKDILARQSENTPLSTDDNEKVSCLGLHSWFYKFITENGAKWQFLRVLGVLPHFEAIRNHLKEKWRHFPMHI